MAKTTSRQESFFERRGALICSVIDLVFHIGCVWSEVIKAKLILFRIPSLDIFDHAALMLLCSCFILFHGAVSCLNLFFGISAGVFPVYVTDADHQYHKLLTNYNGIWCIAILVLNVYDFMNNEPTTLSETFRFIALIILHRFLYTFRTMMRGFMRSSRMPNIVALCDLLPWGRQ